jgi:hypothetical protein
VRDCRFGDLAYCMGIRRLRARVLAHRRRMSRRMSGGAS